MLAAQVEKEARELKEVRHNVASFANKFMHLRHFVVLHANATYHCCCCCQRQDKVQDTVLRMREKVRAMGSRLEEQVHVLRKTNRSSEEADSSKGHRLEDTFVKQQRRVHGCVAAMLAPRL